MSAGADYVAHLQGLGFAVAIMDYDVIERDRSVVDAKLQGAKPSGTSSRFDVVMIMLAVDMGFAQKNPIGRIGPRVRPTRTTPGHKERSEVFSCSTPSFK